MSHHLHYYLNLTIKLEYFCIFLNNLILLKQDLKQEKKTYNQIFFYFLICCLYLCKLYKCHLLLIFFCFLILLQNSFFLDLITRCHFNVPFLTYLILQNLRKNLLFKFVLKIFFKNCVLYCMILPSFPILLTILLILDCLIIRLNFVLYSHF